MAAQDMVILTIKNTVPYTIQEDHSHSDCNEEMFHCQTAQFFSPMTKLRVPSCSARRGDHDGMFKYALTHLWLVVLHFSNKP